MPIRTILSPKTARELLRYDARSGLLTWRVQRGRSARPGDEAGAVRKDGLVAVTVKGKTYLAHRLIWFLVKGEWPEGRLTFHDKDPQNLRWHNIRPESDFFSPTAAAAYLRQHRQKRREAINRGDLDAER